MRAFRKSQQQAPAIMELPVKTAEGSAWAKPWTTGCDKELLQYPLLASCKEPNLRDLLHLSCLSAAQEGIGIDFTEHELLWDVS